MAEYTLVVGAFRHPNDAEYALPAVKDAAWEQRLKVHDAAIVSRSEAGEVQIKDTGDWGFVKGALAGGLVTGAVALLAGPIGWGAVAVAGLAGGVIARVRDAGIKDEALRGLGAGAKQAASALVLMVDPAGEAAITAALTAAGAAATTVGLDEATASRLAAAAGAGGAAAAATTSAAPVAAAAAATTSTAPPAAAAASAAPAAVSAAPAAAAAASAAPPPVEPPTMTPVIMDYGALGASGDSWLLVREQVRPLHIPFAVDAGLEGRTVSVLGRMGVPAESPEPKLIVERIAPHDEIAARAYALHTAGAGGAAVDDWLRAERELLGD